MKNDETRQSDTKSLLKKTRSLAKMIDLGTDPQGLWEPEELGTILKHQLAAPLEFEVIGVDRAELRKLRSQSKTPAEIETFGDLLGHAHPPVALLELTKQFAKASYAHPERPLPDEVAAVLYVASIVVALVRCEKRITRLGDDGLQYGLDRALRQTWLGGSTRGLLEEGRRWIEARKSDRG
ncbi:MAG TPA: hypothetical protein VMY37_21580 [Thermoguttaceae bacterium]|nr:hypothetical protein [Thermoguttaceae bacterium]